MQGLEALLRRSPWAVVIAVVVALALSDHLLASVVAVAILIPVAMLGNYFSRRAR